MATVTERRYTSHYRTEAEWEVRSAEGGTEVEGHAAVFNRPSQDLGGFTERCAPSMFTKTLKDGGDVVCLINHDPNLVLGRRSAKTLDVSTDDSGLYYRVRLPGTQAARDLAVLMDRGDIRHSSFQFQTIRDHWDLDEKGTALRTLLEVRLIDVSPVTMPAYLDTDSGLLTARALEGLARQHGLALAPDEWTRDRIQSLLTEEATEEKPTETPGEPTSRTDEEDWQARLDALLLAEVETLEAVRVSR
jgi:uncharacterized protein